MLKEKDIHNFTITVHALKTTCRMIGAMELSDSFYALEKLGIENNLDKILEYTVSVLADFRSLKPYLAPYAVKKITPDKDFDKEKVTKTMKDLADAIGNYDLARAEECMQQIAAYKFNDELSPLVQKLYDLVSALDYDEAAELSKKIISLL